MKYNVKINSEDKVKYYAKITSPKNCPVCKVTLDPTLIKNAFLDSKKNKTFSINFHCRGCECVFMTKYIAEELSESEYKPSESNFVKSIPNSFQEKQFPESIYKISPKFSTIYNQSLQAEQAGLIEICGGGYRKALEFLVKDFIHYSNPKLNVDKKLLSKCIAENIKSEEIKSVITACTWLANDEVHYAKHWNDEFADIQNKIEQIKRFIDVFVAHVEMAYQINFAKDLLRKHSGRSC